MTHALWYQSDSAVNKNPYTFADDRVALVKTGFVIFSRMTALPHMHDTGSHKRGFWAAVENIVPAFKAALAVASPTMFLSISTGTDRAVAVNVQHHRIFLRLLQELYTSSAMVMQLMCMLGTASVRV